MIDVIKNLLNGQDVTIEITVRVKDSFKNLTSELIADELTKTDISKYEKMTIEELDIPNIRAENCLRAENICFVSELIQHTESDLLKIPNFGRYSLDIIKKSLAKVGLFLKEEI